MKELFIKITRYFVFIIAIFVSFFIIALGNKKNIIETYNYYNIKSIQAIHLVSKFVPTYDAPLVVKTIADVVNNIEKGPIQYDGTMTAYGPDCVGCSGRVSCSPRPDVRNGNIYFTDSEYGEIRIVAADKRVPCGTIVKVSGAKGNLVDSTFYAIVLDRGGVIKETLMDLLVIDEETSSDFGRQKVTYKVLRWGWV